MLLILVQELPNDISTSVKTSPDLGQTATLGNHLADLIKIELIKPLNLITLDFPH